MAGCHRFPSLPLVAAAVTLLLRLPTLLEPYHYADEGIFAAVAQQLLHGGTLYRTVWDDKPPFVYWLYAAVLGAFGPSMPALCLIAALWAALGAAAVAVLGRRWCSPRAGLLAATLFALAVSTPFLEGNLALTELFAATPAAWAFLLADEPGKQGRTLAAGVLLGAAFLFKQVAALDALALGVALVLTRGPRRVLPLLGGWLLLTGIVAGLLVAQGALGIGLRAAFGFYGGYLAAGSGHTPLTRVLGLLPALVALGGALVAARGARLGPGHVLALWLAGAVTGATLAGRWYGHYLVQAAAPAALAAALLASARRDPSTVRALGPVVCCAALLVGATFNRFWLSYPMVRPGYYGNVIAYLSGHRSRAEFEAFFDWRVGVQAELAPIIRADRERTLFIWGEFPWLYALTGAENPTPYVTSYHTAYVPGAKEQVLRVLRARPPRFIVWERDEWRRLPGLEPLLAERYEPVARAGTTALFRRRDGPPVR
jgi:4-amino-4-deoxy-L-arabinose transferase-like glycosyltransferase